MSRSATRPQKSHVYVATLSAQSKCLSTLRSTTKPRHDIVTGDLIFVVPKLWRPKLEKSAAVIGTEGGVEH
jgi:hypothetical protein